jgi:uncharacterized membrane protein
VTEPEPSTEYRLSKARLEALVDGIFAFAMTLLVTGLVIPQIAKSDAASELPGKIAAMRPEFFSFIIAFFVLASFWQVHHRHFHSVRIVTPMLVRINLFILACVVLMPFTTNISGDYSEVLVAVDLFHINMFLLGSLFLAQWWYLTRTPEITSGLIGRSEVINGMRRSVVTPAISALAFAIAFVEPTLSMATYLLIIPAFVIMGLFFTEQ